MPGPLAVPIATWVAEALAAAAGRLAVGAATGAVVGGVASLPGDTPREDSEAKPEAKATDRELACTAEVCKKCPPDMGVIVRRAHGVNWNAYTYQARITGFPFDTVSCRWSDEWLWMGVHFDGFQPGECLLQETKGNYDNFVDAEGNVYGWFKGYKWLRVEARRQATACNSSPPARLRWYFQTPKMWEVMTPFLTAMRIESVLVP